MMHREKVAAKESELKFEITKNYTMFAILCGMRYPKSLWFDDYSLPLRMILLGVSYFADIMLVFFFFSHVLQLIYKGHEDIAVRTECAGSLLVLFYSTYKKNLMFRQRDVFDTVIEELFSVCNELECNPVGNRNYMKVFKKYYGAAKKYGATKFYFTVAAVWSLYFGILIMGMVQADPLKRVTPMEGYYPFELSRFNFFIACTHQLICYHSVILRDITVDATLLYVLAAANVQLVYLRELLQEILERSDDTEQQRKLLAWWVRQHQSVIRVINDYKAISSPCLFVTYGYFSFFSLMVLFRLMEDDDVIVEQQAIIILVNLLNGLNLYVISVMGDRIAGNSTKITEALKTGEFWKCQQRERKAVYVVAIRCTTPIYIRFGDNRILSARSFGSIIKQLMGYFVTIYQIKNA